MDLENNQHDILFCQMCTDRIGGVSFYFYLSTDSDQGLCPDHAGHSQDLLKGFLVFYLLSFAWWRSQPDRFTSKEPQYHWHPASLNHRWTPNWASSSHFPMRFLLLRRSSMFLIMDSLRAVGLIRIMIPLCSSQAWRRDATVSCSMAVCWGNQGENRSRSWLLGGLMGTLSQLAFTAMCPLLLVYTGRKQLPAAFMS